jgi:DNA-binding CsgD family transcriptional regulator
MNTPRIPVDALPEWIQHLGVATWVSAPDGNVIYMNERAEKLLDTEARLALGRPCHEIVAGRDPEGKSWCDAYCPLNRKVDAGEEIEPYTLRVGGAGSDEQWLQMLVIPFENEVAGEKYLAHCAFSVNRAHLIESYLDRVAARTPVNVERNFDLEKSRLSRREREVLELLAVDENLYGIAEKLNVSYYTVRNHVQHILGKMGVHSTLEAVALYLLAKAQEAEASD